MTRGARDPLSLAFIDAYITVFVDFWQCRLDREDASSAPFSALAAERAEELLTETGDCLATVTE